MGRPKGSKNKKYKKSSDKSIKSIKSIKRKVGRPKKVKTTVTKVTKVARKTYAPSKYNDLPDDYIQPKTYMIIGYCPKCDMCIMPSDFTSKTIFECPSCSTKKHKKYLKKKSKRIIEQEKEDARVSKAAYLKEAASKNKQLENQHKEIHHISDIPDVDIMSVLEVKED